MVETQSAREAPLQTARDGVGADGGEPGGDPADGCRPGVVEGKAEQQGSDGQADQTAPQPGAEASQQGKRDERDREHYRRYRRDGVVAHPVVRGCRDGPDVEYDEDHRQRADGLGGELQLRLGEQPCGEQEHHGDARDHERPQRDVGEVGVEEGEDDGGNGHEPGARHREHGLHADLRARALHCHDRGCGWRGTDDRSCRLLHGCGGRDAIQHSLPRLERCHRET